MSLRNHWDLVRSCPNISNRRTRRRRVEWRVSSPAGYKVSVSRRDREGTRRALGATIKGRPRWTMRGRKTRLPPTPSFVTPHCRCRCPLPWSPYTSPAIAQRAPAETDNAPDLSKRTSRGRHNGERVRVIHVRLHSFEAPDASASCRVFRFRALSRILFVAACSWYFGTLKM